MVKEIIDRIEKIDPVNYAKNRNFIDGSVTKLSPYISRGVISTKYVFEKILEHNIPFYKIEKGRADSKSSVGLGLSIASDIIRSHGGNIKLEKSKMNGLRVKIFLPV